MWRVALLAIWSVISVIAVEFVVSTIMLLFLGENMNQPLWSAVYSGLVYTLALILILWVPPKLIKKWRRPTKRELGVKGEVGWTDILLSPIAYVVATFLAAGLIAIFNNFAWFNAGEAQSTGFGLYMNAPERIIAFITLVIVAPIAEEVIFRGWLYGKIRDRLHGSLPEWAGILIATLIVSLAFGVAHLQWNVGVNVFALSVVLCALREVTGKIYAGIFTHMIKNGVAFYLLYIIGFGV